MSNRFLNAPEVQEFKHPLILGCCQKCGLVQLIKPAPAEEIKPRFDWIRYTEPERHLDQLIEALIHLPGISSASHFCGISDIEDSTLQRLQKHSFATSRLDATQEKPKVIIVRRLLEHAQNPLSFMATLSQSVNPNGYIVFEVPDCTKLFKHHEYSAIWEERVSYFTPYTLLKCLEAGGFAVHSLNVYPYTLEDCMVAIVKPAIIQLKNNEQKVTAEKNLAFEYAKHFEEKRAWFKKTLSLYHQQGPVALLGAGHLACHFINLMDVKEYIDFIVDDHPAKIGLFMPGSHLPILSSHTLIEKAVKICLLSVNQESEAKVIAKQKAFTEQGGQFFSIFRASPFALREFQT